MHKNSSMPDYSEPPSPVGCPSREILRLAAEGMRDHSGDLHGFLCAELGNRADADDALQEVFRQFLNTADASQIRDLRRFLYGIARHVVFSEYTQRSRRRDNLNELARQPPGVDPFSANLEKMDPSRRIAQLKELKVALETLTTLERNIVLDIDHGGLSHAEAAQKHDLPIQELRSRYYRALAILRLTCEHSSASKED